MTAKLVSGVVLIIVLAVIIRNGDKFATILNAGGGQLVGFTNAAVGV